MMKMCHVAFAVFFVLSVEGVIISRSSDGGRWELRQVAEMTPELQGDGWQTDESLYQIFASGSSIPDDSSWDVESLQIKNSTTNVTANPLLKSAKKYCEGIGESYMHWVPGRLKVGEQFQRTYFADCPYHQPENGTKCPRQYRARMVTPEENVFRDFGKFNGSCFDRKQEGTCWSRVSQKKTST